MIPGFLLDLVGFGEKGITKGSIASLIQSWYGSIEEGSWFAKLTSIAMRAE